MVVIAIHNHMLHPRLNLLDMATTLAGSMEERNAVEVRELPFEASKGFPKGKGDGRKGNQGLLRKGSGGKGHRQL